MKDLIRVLRTTILIGIIALIGIWIRVGYKFSSNQDRQKEILRLEIDNAELENKQRKLELMRIYNE